MWFFCWICGKGLFYNIKMFHNQLNHHCELNKSSKDEGSTGPHPNVDCLVKRTFQNHNLISTFIQKNPFSIHVCHFYCSLVGRLTLPLWGLIPFATSANSFYSLQCYMHHLPLGWPGKWACACNHEKPFYWKMLIGIWWINTSYALCTKFHFPSKFCKRQ